MNLRTRITGIVIAAFVIMVGTLLAEGLFRARIAEQRLADALVIGDRHAWRGVAGSEARWLEQAARELADDLELVQAVAGDDRTAVRSVLATKRLELERRSDRPRLIRVGLAFVEQARPVAIIGYGAVLVPPVLAEAAEGDAVAGFVQTRTDGIVSAAAAPIYARTGLSGIVVVATALAPLLEEYAGVVDAEVEIMPIEAVTADGFDLATERDGETLASVRLGLLGFDREPLATLLTRRDVTEEQRHLLLLRLASYGAVASAFLLLLGVLQWYMRRAFRPLDRVVDLLNALAQGRRVGQFMPATGNDEIARLSQAAAAFRSNLEALDEARLAQSRIQGELDAAASIQRDLLPPTDAPLAEHPELDIAAVMEPAKVVGGDLFDVFMLDADRLFFLVGDVSDKGMPSALFMAIVRTVFKASAQPEEHDIASLMEEANRYLCRNNPSAMFVTVFAGILDAGSGEVVYCDGGHDAPFIVRAGNGTEFVEKESGLALGTFEEFPYRAGHLTLGPSDMLVLYTDGVTEAMDLADEEFGAGRIRALLDGLPPEADARTATRALLDAVTAYIGEAERSDDITILAIRRRPDTAHEKVES